MIISDEERAAFIALEKDYQRDAFILEFWAARDPYPDTARNELRDRYEERMNEARSIFEVLDDRRAELFLTNGPPADRIVSRCTALLQPLEVWYYRRSEIAQFEFFLVFYKHWGAGKFRLWEPSEGLDALFQHGEEPNIRKIADGCIDGDKLAAGIGWVYQQGMFGYATILQKIERPPDPPKGEWVATFKSYSTDLAQGTPTFPAKLAVDYPGRYQARTVVQGVVTVPVAEAAAVQLGEHRSYNFVLTGEVLQEGKLFESFRYKFDFPADEVAGDELPMIFERTLRPGDYTMALKLEDLNGKRFFREERPLAVPQMAKDLPPPPPADAESARLLAEANAAITTGERTIQLVEPPGDLHTGMLRFETLTTGPGIEKVTFELDGKPVLTKRKPPYSVELDLGSLPRTHELAAVAFDGGGQEVARDAMTLNAGDHRFAVELVEPRGGRNYSQSLRAAAEVQVPEGDVGRARRVLPRRDAGRDPLPAPLRAADPAARGQPARLRPRRRLPRRRRHHRGHGLRQRPRLPRRAGHRVRRALHDRRRPPGAAGRGADAEGLRRRRGRRQAGGGALRDRRRPADPRRRAARRLGLDGAGDPERPGSGAALLREDGAAQGPGGARHLQRPPGARRQVHQRAEDAGRRRSPGSRPSAARPFTTA